MQRKCSPRWQGNSSNVCIPEVLPSLHGALEGNTPLPSESFVDISDRRSYRSGLKSHSLYHRWQTSKFLKTTMNQYNCFIFLSSVISWTKSNAQEASAFMSACCMEELLRCARNSRRGTFIAICVICKNLGRCGARPIIRIGSTLYQRNYEMPRDIGSSIRRRVSTPTIAHKYRLPEPSVCSRVTYAFY